MTKPSNALGLSGFGPLLERGPAGTEIVQHRRPLHRILAFTRRSIDDVVNSRIAKNEVAGYYKLSRMIDRQMEVRELERQWNPLGV